MKRERSRRRKKKNNSRILLVGCLFLMVGLLFALHTYIFQKNNATFFHFEEEIEPIVIVLDSGHSRVDGGAVGIVNEEWITEKTTENLRELLEADERFSVVLTHTYDAYVSITERRERAEAAGADLFLSIHCNSNVATFDISGFEVYPQLPENSQWAESYRFAEMIAEGFVEAEHSPRKENGIFYVRYEEDSAGNSIKYTLTEAEEEMYQFTGETLGVLKSEQFPSVLVEQGYVTSQSDVENWMSDEGCQKAAEIYYEAIIRYFEEQELAEEESDDLL